MEVFLRERAKLVRGQGKLATTSSPVVLLISYNLHPLDYIDYNQYNYNLCVCATVWNFSSVYHVQLCVLRSP